jgi:hypothetical protein
MKIEKRLFASAIAVGLVVFAGKPAGATCLTQPDLRAHGGRWHYRIDRPTQRKCWYQQTSSIVAPSAPSSPSLWAASQALPASPSLASSDLFAWLSSISAAITSNVASVGAQNEAQDARSSEPARDPSSRSHLRPAQRDRSHNRRPDVEQVSAKHVKPHNSRALQADAGSGSQDVKALLQEFQDSQEFQDFLLWKRSQSAR